MIVVAHEAPALVAGYDPFRDAGDCWYDGEAAQRAVDFFHRYLKHVEGRQFAGKPLELQTWQEDIVRTLFGWKRADGTRRYRTCYVEIPRKNGKALALDTPLPTPGGWTTMGAVRVGDYLFDENGLPTRVVAATEVLEHRPCYEVVFSDGCRIIADAEHEWVTSTRAHGGRCHRWTTKEVAESLYIDEARSERNHRIAVAGPLVCDERFLPVDPYVLGAWLGDGHSASARLTNADCDSRIVDEIRAAGVTAENRGTTNGTSLYKLGRRAACGKSLQSTLRKIGVLGNKHVPAAYLRASHSQRLALMQGLMDTDGFVSKAGQCEFVTTKQRLCADFMELSRSLGFKPSLKVAQATLYGKKCGLSYRIQFWAFKDTPVFRLARKASRQKETPVRSVRSQNRQIVSVESVPSVPVRCVQVDSPSHLYLAGESMVPTHNSTLAAGIALYLLACDREPGVQVYGAAQDRDQATIVFRTASAMVAKSRALARRIRVLSSQKQMLLPDEPNSFYKVIAADAAGSHGFNPHGIVFDELHTQPNRDLWDVLESGKGARAQPLTFAISTAGHDRLSICWEQHEYARSVRDGLYDPSFLPVLYGAADDADWMDESVWRAANPNLGISVSLEFLRDELRKAQENPAEENKFRNLYLNQWTQQLTRYIPMHLWDQAGCRKQLEPPKYAPCYGGLDLAKTQDLTAWVLVFPKGKKFVVKAKFWIPEETAIQRERQHGRPYRLWAKQGLIELVPGRVMDYRMVRRQIVRDAERYDMQQMAYDPWNATETATILREEDGIDALEFRQSIVNLNEPTRMLLELVREERLIHGGHEVLRWNADCLEVKTDASGNVRPVKPDHATPARIDGMLALIMALGLAVRQPDTSSGGIFAL